MWDNIKTYLIEAGLKKYTPMAVIGGVTAFMTFMAAHQGMLEQWGVTFGTWPLAWSNGDVPSGQVILVELDTFKVSAIALVATLGPVIMRALQHHTTGTPITPAATPPKGV